MGSTEKNNENNRYSFIFPNLLWSLSLKLMWSEGERDSPSAISTGSHSTISEWLLPSGNIVGSCGLRAKGNTSVSSTSSFCHLFLMCSSTWDKVLLWVRLHFTWLFSHYQDFCRFGSSIWGVLKEHFNSLAWLCLWLSEMSQTKSSWTFGVDKSQAKQIHVHSTVKPIYLHMSSFWVLIRCNRMKWNSNQITPVSLEATNEDRKRERPDNKTVVKQCWTNCFIILGHFSATLNPASKVIRHFDLYKLN